MSRETALAALQTLTDEEADILNSDPNLLERFRQKHGLPSSSNSMNDSGLPFISPTQLIERAAPSNLMKLAGVASVNAPGAVGTIINSFPAIGNPSQIVPAVKNVQKNPGQIIASIKRMSDVQNGAQLTAIEKKPAIAGQIAGTALEMMAPSLGTKNIKADTPFKAGLKDPSSILPGAFEKVGKEYGSAKSIARMGENVADTTRLRVLLSKPAGVAKVAEEGKAMMESGKEVSVTRLLAYREALGKMQAEGGTFANDYAVAKDKATELLKQKAPDLVAKMEKMAIQYAAKGDGKTLPWFTLAVNPKVGAAKAATWAPASNAIGAAANPAITKPGAIAAMVKNLTEDKAREYLKKAKGNRDKARNMAKNDGWGIPE